MNLSNLPPGCSSPDGGIDHAFEEVIEKIAQADLSAEKVARRWESQPKILDALRKAERIVWESASDVIDGLRQLKDPDDPVVQVWMECVEALRFACVADDSPGDPGDDD